MTLSRHLAFAAMLAALSPLAVPAAGFAQPAAANANYITRDQLPDLLRDILVNNPDILEQAVAKIRANKQKEAQVKAKQQMGTHKKDIYDDALSPSVGNPKASDITMVEFYDYHCGYCKKMLPTVNQLIKDDKKVHVIFKEFPILSEDSVTASEAALAVYRIAPAKFFDYHQALMHYSGKFDEAALTGIAGKLGIDGDKLKAEMAKPEISDELKKNHQLGMDLGVHGTPAILVGETLIPGAIDYPALQKVIADVRSGKKPDVEQDTGEE